MIINPATLEFRSRTARGALAMERCRNFAILSDGRMARKAGFQQCHPSGNG